MKRHIGNMHWRIDLGNTGPKMDIPPLFIKLSKIS